MLLSNMYSDIYKNEIWIKSSLMGTQLYGNNNSQFFTILYYVYAIIIMKRTFGIMEHVHKKVKLHILSNYNKLYI